MFSGAIKLRAPADFSWKIASYLSSFARDIHKAFLWFMPHTFLLGYGRVWNRDCFRHDVSMPLTNLFRALEFGWGNGFLYVASRLHSVPRQNG